MVKKMTDVDDKIQKALEKNDEEWQKRMLLLVLVMIVAVLGLG